MLKGHLKELIKRAYLIIYNVLLKLKEQLEKSVVAYYRWLSDPLLKAYFKELTKRKDLIVYLTLSKLKGQHKNSFLGYFWWLLDPMLNVGIYYFVVVIIFRRGGGPDYGMYLVVGMIVWRWVSATVSTASKSIIAQAGIITQVYLPKANFPIGAVLTQLINFIFGVAVIAISLVFFKVIPGINMLWLPVIIALQLVFMMALALPVAYLSVFVRDFEYLVDHLMRIWFFTSPVFWRTSMMPEKVRWLTSFNPMTHFLSSYRNVIIL